MAEPPSSTPTAGEAPSTPSPSPARIRIVEIGTMRNDVRRSDLECADGTFVTRLDMQTIVHTYYGGPYISGLRIYCTGHPPGEFQHTVNWSPSLVDGVSTYANFEGGIMDDGVRHVVAASRVYVELFGYGSSTVVGGGNGARTLWQQATRQDLVDCRLKGIEAIWYSWMDGMRLRYACPQAAATTALSLASSSVTRHEQPTGHPSSSANPSVIDAYETCPFFAPVGIGVSVGLVLASWLFLGWLAIQRWRSRVTSKTKVDHERLVPLLAVDPALLSRAPTSGAPFHAFAEPPPVSFPFSDRPDLMIPEACDDDPELYLPQSTHF